MAIDISLENERFIEQAIADGRFASRDDVLNEAVRVLRQESELNGVPEQDSETDDEWVADLRAWAASHRSVTHFVDDSRESIYAGRGE